MKNRSNFKTDTALNFSILGEMSRYFESNHFHISASVRSNQSYGKI
ncbi:hypothetical protein QE435_000596 [Rhizobium sp. SORGH_AS 787]|nr:hypothetical protein [Rhizobium sp. SORGH_AS_0787]